MKTTFKSFFIFFIIIFIVIGCGKQTKMKTSEPMQTVIVFGHKQHFFALNKITGKVEWRVTTKGDAQVFPIVNKGIAYGLSGDFYAMSVTDGKLLWTLAGIKGLLPIAASDHLLVGMNLESIDLFDPQDQSKQSILTNGLTGSGYATVQDGILYYGTNNSKFIAMDINARKNKWSFDTNGRFASPPIIAGDTIVFNDYDQGHTRFFYGLDRKTGNKKWGFAIQDDALAMAANEGFVYYAAKDGEIHALDANTGKEQWSTPTEINSTFSPVTAKGILCFSSGNGFIYGFDPSSKEIKWKSEIVPLSPPTIIDNTLYVNSIDGLHSLDVTSGKENWAFHLDGEMTLAD